ncbi:MAG: toprim domain-containing protein, partial [Oscillospiraceae bacterium]|nr:toprim domain-containing protein [Oscillospiraceae bacterium]
MTREQAAEYIKAQSPEAFLPKAKKRGYVCPLCGNGTGSDGDGIVKNPRDGRYYCFKCGEAKGDIFDIIGAAFGLHDFNSQFDKAAEIYGVTVDEFAPVKKGRGKNGKSSNVSKGGKKKTAHRDIVSGDISGNINKAVFSVIDGRLSVTVPRNNPSNNSQNNSESTTPLSPAVTDEYIEKCHGNASMTDYFKVRGIGNELVNKFRLGFDPAFPIGGGQTREAVILPTEAGSFEARFIDTLPDSKEGAGAPRYRKRGRTAIFNVNALRFGVNGINSASAANITNGGNAINGADNEAPGKPVFVCEGIFDALSVMECGGEAVALGSAANWRLLVSEIEKHGAAVPLVLFLDNDEAGKNAAARVFEALTAAGVYCIDGSEGLCSGGSNGKYHDPNARLLSDRAGLGEAVKRLEEKCAPLSEDILTEEACDFEAVNAGACLAAFRAQIEKSADVPVCGTGFSALDRAVNGGLYAGLYVLGAASSVGKTTFLLQIADNAAAAGRDVLFFSLEQSRFELIAKSVSRESFMYCRENHLGVSAALSSLDVLDGGRHGGF